MVQLDPEYYQYIFTVIHISLSKFMHDQVLIIDCRCVGNAEFSELEYNQIYFQLRPWYLM